jgi:hypothetical protein
MFNCKISQCFNVARSREENSSKFPKRMNDGATLQTTAPFHMRVSCHVTLGLRKDQGYRVVGTPR